MAVKFDKDMLIKQRFWVLLAVTVPLVIAAVFILITSVGAEIEKKRKDAKQKLDAISNIKNPVGQQVIDVREKQAAESKQNETIVHANAFSAQNQLFTWPKAIEDRFDFQKGLFATEIKIMPPPANAESWPTDAGDLFHGRVTSIDRDAMVLKGKDNKEAKFYQTFKVNVSKQDKKDNEKEQWQTITSGDFVAVNFYRSKYFYDQLTEEEWTAFVNSYKSQIHPILKMVDPVDPKGAGTVQFKGWPYKENDWPAAQSKFFTYVAEDWKVDGFIYEEAWFAQEDLWIQRELFRIIRAANDSVAVCEFQAPDPNKVTDKNFEDKSKPLVFANPNYELTFEWKDAGKIEMKVKNRLPRRQKLDVHFRVKFNKSANQDLATEVFLVDGEPLDPRGMTKDTKVRELVLDKNRQRTGIYSVEQVLTWETAAVKRIDTVAIGSPTADISHSHKTFPEGSKPYRKEEKKEEKKDEGAGGAPMGGPMGAFGGGPRGGAGGQAAGEMARGINGVLKDRYLAVSEQSRRVPVGLALIIDQDHIGRVLTAFNNSKLRFLTTQVLLNRYSASVRPQVAGGATDLGGGAKEADSAPPEQAPSAAYGAGPRGGSSGGPPKGFGSAGGPPMGSGQSSGGGPRPQMGPMQQPPMGNNPMIGGAENVGAYASAAAAGASEELENNVEMVIYGVVTLYERYPKRKVEVK